MKVYVIDDESCITDSIKIYLEGYGHEVMTASKAEFLPECNGSKCQADSPCCDLLITDQNMPDMTGLEFLEKLSRRKCLIPSSRQIIITGDVNRIDERKVEEIGCRIVEKPMRFKQLDEILRQTEKNIFRKQNPLQALPSDKSKPYVPHNEARS